MNINWQTIFNPFKKFSERNLLIFGIIITIAGSLIGWLCSITFSGLFDVQIAQKQRFTNSLGENLLNIAICFLLLFALSKFINVKTRAIDVLNVSLLYRLPLYVLATFSNNKMLNELGKKVTESAKDGRFQLNLNEMIVLMIFSIIALAFVIYAIVLLVNGFKTAANVKKWQHFVLLTVVLVIGEFIISHLLIQKILG